MRFAILLPLLALTGCMSYSREVANVKHVDGSGTTTYRAIHAGGILRPGVIVVVSQTLGSNPPIVLVQASGPPMTPALMGAAGTVGAAFALGAALKPDENTTTTVIEAAPTVVKPPSVIKPPAPTPVPTPPNRPPGNRPPYNRPPNRGH
jgi:hypothetical protein